MDSSLTSEVLLELLLRGGYTTSTLQALDMDNLQEEGSDLALNIIPIRGLDFCGCISRRFVQSLEVLVERFHLNAPLGARRTFFPHLRRLGLFDAGSIRPNLLTSFVTSFPGKLIDLFQ